MEEKKYGKERREKSSFGSKKENDRKSGDANPRFKKDSESRTRKSGDQSENSDRRRSDSNRTSQSSDSRSREPRKFDDNRSEDSNRKFDRDSESRTRNYGDRSEYSNRRNSESNRGSHGSDSRSPRRFDSNRLVRDSDRRHKRENSSYRSERYSDKGEERSEFKEKRRFTDDSNENQDSNKKPYDRFENKPNKETLQKKHYSKKKQLAFAKKSGPEDGMVRLNKYISNTGACSRREADKRIEDGRITVNNKVVKEVGTKVNINDVVCMDDKQLQAEAKVYLVLNKPKDFVTTLDDPMGRKTVLDLIQHACTERVYPVGRLDRMTTGVLLFTNDGDLTKRLTHPSYNKKKIYHVFLDRAISQEELNQVSAGIELEDGEISADAISFADPNDKTQVGIEIHSGRNRIVRRIFEHLGYEVEKLDRVFFAGITKKNIPRGKWRFLSEKEVTMLKIY
ncbi:MAG: pseudouridine synthase [Bacteroidales bacterium]|nr:MAG: pseudouridine synthase [Bacteroidales bacterium]